LPFRGGSCGRTPAALFTGFAVLALARAAIGLFSVVTNDWKAAVFGPRRIGQHASYTRHSAFHVL
jgi:hypothetical protein